jgi:hypothetical protein
VALKARLNSNTKRIRESIRAALQRKDFRQARQILLNFYWLKLGPHELLFDHIQFDRRSGNEKWIKGRWGLNESEKWTTLTGIRNRVVNVIRYGEHLQTDYVKRLNKKLPGFSPGTRSTFLSSGVSWNRYGLCAFDCGPVFWSRRGFVHFRQVKRRMNEQGWPVHFHLGRSLAEKVRSLQGQLPQTRGPPAYPKLPQHDPNSGFLQQRPKPEHPCGRYQKPLEGNWAETNSGA